MIKTKFPFPTKHAAKYVIELITAFQQKQHRGEERRRQEKKREKIHQSNLAPSTSRSPVEAAEVDRNEHRNT